MSYVNLTHKSNVFKTLVGPALCCCGLMLLCGCQQQENTPGEVLDESWFSLKEDTPSDSADAPAATTAKAELAVNLKRGDKFPLHKTVEKTLTQSALQGAIESTERIELFMSITVEEIRDQNKKFRIHYNRVKYQSKMGNTELVYDSSSPQFPIPDQALAYHGMVNNGFSFWVGRDNKITDVADLSTFMRRCLNHVPPDKSEVVSQMLAQHAGQEGIANFVDDTIGLLPYDPDSPDGTSVIRLGGNWSKTRHFNDPVPMSLNSTYTLQDLNDQYATIDLVGDIVPAAGVSDPQQAVSLQIRGGHTVGTCQIDRKTGLPIQSHTDHQITMAVQVNDVQLEQHKRVVTRIRMYPEQGAADVSPSTADARENASGLRLTPATQSSRLPR